MNTSPILALALAVLLAHAPQGLAQQKATEVSRAAGAGVAPSAPAADQRTVDKVSPKLATGEVTGRITTVDPSARTFAAMVQGRAVTFSAGRLSTLPRVGETLDIAFTLAPDRLPMATSATAPGSTARPHIGGNQHCDHPLVGHHDPLLSLNVCKY